MNSRKTKFMMRPRGKESSKVRIIQNKGKESGNSHQKLKRSWWTGTYIHSLLIENDGRVRQNISILFPCVCLCACPP